MKHISTLIFGMLITFLASTSAYAAGAALPEGVYLIGGETVIVDLTAPTGDIQVDKVDSASANSFKNANNILLKPTATTLDSVIQAHDNFEENGSFKEWKILRKTGKIISVGGLWNSCDFYRPTGELVETLTQGTPDYTTNPTHSNAKQTDDASGNPIKVTVQDNSIQHGKCYSYQLVVEDNAGNKLQTNESGVNNFRNWSAPIFVDDTNGIVAGPTNGAPKLTVTAIPVDPTTGADLAGDASIITTNSAFQGTNGTSSGTVSSAWTNKDVKISWSSTDGESGLDTITIAHTKNGVDDPSDFCGKKADGTVQTCGVINLADIANYNGGYFSTHDLVAANQDEGVHVITITIKDASGNTTVSTYTINIDKTKPSLSWDNTSTGGDATAQLAGIGKWTFGFDDLNNGNKSSSTGASYVAQIQKDDITIKYDKCLDDTCATVNNLVSITGNTVTEADTTWADVLDAFNWNNLDAANSLADKQVEIKHSKYFGGTATGKYKISYTLTDRAGNQSTLSKIISVEPNQMDSANSTLTLAAGCNNGTWKADASSTCSATATLKDQYQNPLYSRPSVNINGQSDTSYDQIHMPNPDTNDKYEAVFFSNAGTVDTEEKGIRIANSFTTQTNGSVTFDMVSYAPTFTAGKTLDFTIATKPHTALNYATGGNGAYNITDQENAKAYAVATTFDLTSLAAPAFFQKNATQSFNAVVANTVAANATNERIGLYVYAKLTGAYNMLNMDTAATTESSTAWVNNGTATEKNNALTNLGISSFAYDGAALYSSNDTSGTYTFQVRASKRPGVQSFDTTVDIKPFARMTITRGSDSKEVAYPLLAQEHNLIPLYNQALATQGAGLVQGSGSSAVSGDAASQSSSQISIQTLTTQLKETVKKEILNIPDLSGVNSTEVHDLNNFDSSVIRMNNKHTYVVKGDDQDLIIAGVNGTLEIGSEPLAFITYGGNIIVKANIEYTSTIKPTIAFISLRNEVSGKGGEIRIANVADDGSTAITNLVGSFFAERGVVGIDNTGNTALTAEARQTALTHQLVIQGSVMGGNTLGGGDDPLTCPSFIKKASCLEDVAQKYDLNYLRRYVPGVGTSANPSPASDKPVIIQYYMNKELLPQELLMNN